MKDKLFMGFLRLCLVWVVFALCFDVYMITLSYVNQEESDRISKELTWKFDGTFKNNPNNIWYKEKK